MDNLDKIWGKTKESIKKTIGDSAFEAWFSNTCAKQIGTNNVIIEVADSFFKDWLSNHYFDLIEDALRRATANQDLKIEIGVNPDLKKTAKTTKDDPQKDRLAQFQSKLQEQRFGQNVNQPGGDVFSLNPKYTFDAFVIGPSNRFANAAFMAVAESPARAYNPLFIYGGVGLGKTHLMQAIGHHIYKKNPNVKLCYISSEQFTNGLIDAIQHRSTQRFRQKYRTVDILLIDDIQFIANKEATQEEFFHTFNTLYDAHKQIVVSSDRPPKEIPSLEQRLVSRFEWGLITDIQPPDLETRIAILKKKLEAEKTFVPDDVIGFIAEGIKTNIRELEGALIRVVAYALLEKKSISLELAKDVLKDMVRESHKNIDIDFIQKVVADYFNIKLLDLKTKGRSKNIVFPRQIAMFLSREMTSFSLPELGGYFGGKDHTTILHAYNKIKEEIIVNKDTKKTVDEIVVKIKS